MIVDLEVNSGAERRPVSSEYDSRYRLIYISCRQTSDQFLAHRRVKCISGLWPIQTDQAHRAVILDLDEASQIEPRAIRLLSQLRTRSSGTRRMKVFSA